MATKQTHSVRSSTSRRSSSSSSSHSSHSSHSSSPSSASHRARSSSPSSSSVTRSTTATHESGQAAKGKDKIDISEDARSASASEAAGSPVNFRSWDGQSSTKNGNVGAVEAPGAGKSLKDNSAADARLADKMASQPLQLDKGEMLSRGDEGDKVAHVQSMLNKYANQKLDVDGDMGRKTSRAVRSFQREQGLRVDGIVGPRTQEALNKMQSEAARKAQESVPPTRDTAGVQGQSGTQSGPAPHPVRQGDHQETAGIKGQEGSQSGPAPEKTGGLPPARPDNGTPTSFGRLDTLQSAQKNGDGSYSFRSGASIDVDGSGPHHGDPKASSGTSLEVRDANGRKQALNADKTPYFVLPPQVASKIGAQPGDLGLISYNGKTVPAVFGDRGPGHRIGEISRKAAQDLGIPDSPISGGVPSGVDYRVFPGSHHGPTKASDVTPERLNERVQQLLKQDTEKRAGEVGAATATQQVNPNNGVQADQGGQTRPNLPVPVPNGLRGIMKTFGPAGSQNLRRVMAAAGPGGKEIPVSMHTKIADQFKQAFDEIKRQGLSDEIKAFDGSYNNRSKTSGNGKSTHAWGIAFDINADQYPYGTRAQNTSARFKKIAEILDSYGFRQLPKDPMHFQYATGY